MAGMLSGKSDDLIADAGNCWEKKWFHQYTLPYAVPRENGQRVKQYTDKDHHKQEAGAAAWMETGISGGVFRSQRVSRFIAGHRLMLRAVICKGAAHIR